MAPISAYPRSTLRSLLKAWSPEGSATLSRDFDALAYVAYLTFLQRLAKESRIVADREMGVTRRKTGAIKKTKKLVLGKKEIRKAKKVRPTRCLMSCSRAGADVCALRFTGSAQGI
jgi:hypothetical protein